jgi:hypothetical protein
MTSRYILPFFILLISCQKSHEGSLNNYFSSQYSSEEKKVANCVEEVKKTCRGISCYEKVETKCLEKDLKDNRAPASSMAQMQAQLLIEQNGWLFSSPAMIRNFINFMSDLKKMKKRIPETQKQFKKYLGNSLHGRGIGFYGAAHFGVSKKWVGELVLHKKNLAVFCAPSNGLIFDAGVEAGLSALSTLGCRENNDYQGTFLTGSFGVSTEALLIPLGASLSYSFGVDSKKFNQRVIELRKDKKISLKKLLKEIEVLKLRLSYDHPLVFSLLHKMSRFLFKSELNQDDDSVKNESRLVELLKRKTSLGLIFKDFASSVQVKDELDKNGLDQLKALINLIDVSLTGCDSVSGSAGLSLSLSPINIGFAQAYYTKAIEIDSEDYDEIIKLGYLSLVNPILLAPSTVPLVIKYAKRVRDFRSLVNACAIGDMKDFENFIYFD